MGEGAGGRGSEGWGGQEAHEGGRVNDGQGGGEEAHEGG